MTHTRKRPHISCGTMQPSENLFVLHFRSPSLDFNAETAGAVYHVEGDALLTLANKWATRRKSRRLFSRFPLASLSSFSFSKEITAMCDVLGITTK